MERKEAIRSAYRLTGESSFYDGMITCSTLSGKAVCRLVWAMNKAENDAYLEKAMSGIPEHFSGKLLEVPVGTGILTMPVSFLQKIYNLYEVLFCLLEDRQHTVAMHHLRAGGHRIGDICPFAGLLKVRQCAVEHLVGRIEEVNIAYAGKISPGAGEHIVRHILTAMPHELLHRHHAGAQ